MHFNVYGVFYSQFPHQRVSAAIAASSGWCYYYKNTRYKCG